MRQPKKVLPNRIYKSYNKNKAFCSLIILFLGLYSQTFSPNIYVYSLFMPTILKYNKIDKKKKNPLFFFLQLLKINPVLKALKKTLQSNCKGFFFSFINSKTYKRNKQKEKNTTI